MQEGIGKMEASVSESNFDFGYVDNKRWIRGWVPIGKNKRIYVDTLSGQGVNDVLKVLNKFITYQASKVTFPAFSREDTIQEIRLLALEAIPKYDITRNTNIITFLQNHIKNRIINLCKFVSEKRRRATFLSNAQIKVKCPNCKSFTKINSESEKYSCSNCGLTAERDDASWRKYNMPVVTIPYGSVSYAGESQSGEPQHWSFIENVSTCDSYQSFVSSERVALDKQVELKIDFMEIFDKLDDVNKQIITMVIEGYTYKEIAKKVGISEKAAYARATKFIRREKIL